LTYFFWLSDLLKDQKREGGHVVLQNEAYREMKKKHPKEKDILHINKHLFVFTTNDGKNYKKP